MTVGTDWEGARLEVRHRLEPAAVRHDRVDPYGWLGRAAGEALAFERPAALPAADAEQQIPAAAGVGEGTDLAPVSPAEVSGPFASQRRSSPA